jgi:BlaI family transcriptional regulator, penicillinase repressor
MATKKKPRRLSAGELEILQMLWRDGPVTLSAAQRGLGRAIGYTTVQTRLNRLVEKGVVTRTAERPAEYRAAVATEDVSAGHLDLLLERVSGGSIVPLVAHLMKGRRLSREETLALRKLISESERQNESQEPQGGRR